MGHRYLLVLVVAAALFSAPQGAMAYSEAQFNAVTSEEETQVQHVRQKEITQLKIVSGRRFAEGRRPDILLRLAELYIENYRFYFFKENEIYQSLYKRGLKPKSVDHRRSRAELKKATNACLAILKSRVPFPKLDQVYYFLGYNSEEMGQKRQAEKYFKTVVTRYPRSVYAPEAYRNLAEYSFGKKRYHDAVKYYEQAAAFTKVPSYPRTLYKLAWAYFKTRKRSQALSTMKRVVDLAESGGEKFVGLREEALNDLVLFFSEAGRWKDAREYFQRISGGAELYVKALSRLSKMYERRGDRKLALSVNNALIEEYGEKRPELVFEVLASNVEIYQKAGDGAGEERALERLVSYLSKSGDRIRDEDGGQESLARIRSYLRARATDVHKQAQKKKNKSYYARAAHLYGLYIKGFLAEPQNDKERKELSEIRTYRSDALLAAGKESDAFPELERTLRADGDAKHRKTAGTTLLNLLIKRLDASVKKGRPDSVIERKFLEVSEVFEKAFPDDSLVAELRYKKARLAAAKSGPEGLSSEAREALTELVEKYPSRQESVEAAQELVADAVKRKEMDYATELARKFNANAALMKTDRKDELRKYLNSVISHHSFSNVQALEKDNEHLKAAQGYERLADAPSANAEVRFKALHNAAVNYERAGQPADAVRVFFELAAKNPKNKSPLTELKRIAATYLWESRFNDAAKLYGRLARKSGYSDDEQMSFTRTAFYLEWGTGDIGTAFVLAHTGLREHCATGRKKYSDSECHDLAIDLGRMLMTSGKTQEAIDHLKQYLRVKAKGVRKAEAAIMLASIYHKLRESRKTALYYEEASRAVARTKGRSSDTRERNFAAKGAFMQVEPHFARFMGTRLELPESKLKRLTRSKLNQLEGLVTRYSNVIGYGDGEWGIAAFERLHDAFDAFADELEGAPVPSKLEGSAREQYLRGIRQVSTPMRERALDYLKQGYQKGIQLEVTTPTYIALTQRLAKKAAKEYPPAHYTMLGEEDGEVRKTTLSLSGVLESGDRDDLRKSDHSWRRRIAARLQQNPKSPDTWVEFGNLEALSGRLTLARMMYEQAVALNKKHAQALANLSVVLFLEQHPIDATQGLMRAADLAEADRNIRFNLAKSLLAYHHFSPALKHLKSLHARFPEDAEISEALGAALLGAGRVSEAGALLNQIDAEGSNRFSLWYNWSIWALIAGDEDQREDALDKLKDKLKRNLAALEKSQVELALELFGGGKTGTRK